MLEVNIRKNLNSFTLAMRFRTSGKILVLFGASGSGKTLTLKHIAGFLRPEQGFVRLNQRLLYSSQAEIDIKPEKRKIGYVLQEPYLFPHLSIRKNLLFAQSSIRQRELDAIISILDLQPLLNRLPAHLSGGEKQRVAIGRMLLSSPHIVLMDEPVSSLDSKSKWKILEYVRQLNTQLGIDVIYVTHSYEETEYLADEIGLIEDGKLITCGSKESVLHSTDFFSSALKDSYTNFFKARVLEHEAESGMYRIAVNGKQFRILPDKPLENHTVYVSVAAHNIVVMNTKPSHISTRNIQQGIIQDIIYAGVSVILVVDGGIELLIEVTKSAVAELQLRRSKKIYYLIKASAFKIYY